MKNSTRQSLKLLVSMIIILSQPFMLQSALRKTARSATRGSLGRVSKASVLQSLPSCNLNTPLESSSYLQRGMRKSHIGRAFKRGFGRTIGGESGPLLIRGTASNKAQSLKSYSGGKRSRGRTGERWCAALGAVGFTGAAILSEEEKKEQIQSDLKEFRRLLKFYEKKEPIMTFIEKLAKDGAINEKDEYNITPSSLIITKGLRESETVEILTAMIEHGAIPRENELKNAFGLTHRVNIPSESAQFVAYWSDELNPTPKNNILKVILPHYDQKTLSNLINLAENKIIKLNNKREETLSQERDYENQLNKLLEWKENLQESLLKQPDASKLIEEQILDVDTKIASARNRMALMKGREEDIRSDLLLFTELKTIVKESLYVRRVANKEKEEAEIK